MKIQSIIIGIILVTIAFYLVKTKLLNQQIKPDNNTARPSNEHLRKEERKNDKLVLVENISNLEVDSILKGFCNVYNKETFQAQPRLYKLKENEFAITFPFDIDFEIYCYFINYVHYPMGFNRSFYVKGWTTTQSGQNWVADKVTNKKVMLFIPSDDTEHDNVFLTTSDNIGYKLGFAMGEEKQFLDQPKQHFISPGMEIKDLINKEYKDFN
ncbi:hypothetical protein [Pedobacter nototheniae]|uniref:hypothetical protein n=1 Tax=Pedobacter nototheniae TaxID=2488994 RepID=UPI0029316A16|nr:hypothetical protein [Pedobacter nototheniae]